MQKVLSFLKRSLSVAFLFAVLFNSVGASAADTYKGGLSDNQVKYNNYWNCNSSVPTKNYVLLLFVRIPSIILNIILI